MAKMPAFQFYPSDWRSDTGVQSLSFHERGIWFEMICLMHESEDRGKLMLNGKAMPDDTLSRVLGLHKQTLDKALSSIFKYGVASRCEKTGAIMSRRMVADENLRYIRQQNGLKGGNPFLLNQKVNQAPNQNAPPRVKQKGGSSSSTSSSSSKTTTSFGTENEDIGEVWNFSIADYAKFGFSRDQLKQLAMLDKLSPLQVQQSLVHFLYDFENKLLPKIKTTPINFLMGLLMKGNPYVSEGIITYEEQIINEMARRYKGKEKKRLYDELLAWESTLNDEQKKIIDSQMTPHLKILYRSHGILNDDVQKWLLDYFLENNKFDFVKDIKSG